MSPISRLSVGRKLAMSMLLLAAPAAYLLVRYATSSARAVTTADIVAVGATLALAAAVAVSVARHVVESLRTTRRAVEHLESGDLGNAIEAPAGDEWGALLASLGRFQQGLRQRAERERAAAAGDQQARAALDKVAINVMLADLDGNITYMNEAVTEMFRTRTDEIRKQIPQFDPTKMLGGSFDRFH